MSAQDHPSRLATKIIRASMLRAGDRVMGRHDEYLVLETEHTKDRETLVGIVNLDTDEITYGSVPWNTLLTLNMSTVDRVITIDGGLAY